MFTGIGRPGQRESATASTETLVTVPLEQYLFAGAICSIVGVADLFWVYLTLQRAGTRITWLAVMVVLLLVAWRLYKWGNTNPALNRWRFYPSVSVGITVAVVMLWLMFGEDIVWYRFTIDLGFDGADQIPILLIVFLSVPLVAFTYFAYFVCWGWRNDMASKSVSGWTATRQQIPGNTEPELPGTHFAPMTKQPEETRNTALLREYQNDRTWELPDGTQVPLYDLLMFLRGSEVGNRGLTREVAEACGMRRTVQKKIVHRLQDLGLATPNGQGVVARIVKSSDLVLKDLGFNLEAGGEAEQTQDENEAEDDDYREDGDA